MKEEHILTEDQKLQWWGKGPWTSEPDKVTFEHNGLKCLIRRIYHDKIPEDLGGYFCGYVEIDEGHPLYHSNKRFDADVHGGVTWNGFMQDTYYVGFDCNHAWDISPAEQKLELCRVFDAKYRDINYVIEECKYLANQIKDYKVEKEDDG